MVQLGVTQKVIADKIGVRDTWLSRWLNQRPDIASMDVPTMDALNAFIADFTKEMNRLADESKQPTTDGLATQGEPLSDDGDAPPPLDRSPELERIVQMLHADFAVVLRKELDAVLAERSAPTDRAGQPDRVRGAARPRRPARGKVRA